MDAELSALLRSWEWRFVVIAVVMLSGSVYINGFFHIRTLRNRSTSRDVIGLVPYWRLLSYLGGLICIILALLSPVEVLSGQLFFMHMIQHMLLVMCAPPLLLISNPFPILLWGLPAKIRTVVGGLFVGNSWLRKLLKRYAGAGTIWMIFVIVYIGWHDPTLYEAALRSKFVHDIEHISFFVVSMLFWWHVTSAAPRVHQNLAYGKRIAYLLVTVPVNMISGVIITFSRQPIYEYYVKIQRPWSLTVMQDQMLGGIIMWIPGSMMLIVAIIVLVVRMMASEERNSSPRLHEI
jgi:cytochrome c oxidase assembly factor CtaG